jgi:L,D-peptidoglycan transpeptidase YkuD (ErfK/YbiS/YcfS/YnhG family)
MGWCDDPQSKFYNKEINIQNNEGHEKLFRKDCSYDCFIVINYNTKNIKPKKGSAIFLHLTKNYKKTAGCIAVKEKDLFVILKLITKTSKIKIH